MQAHLWRFRRGLRVSLIFGSLRPHLDPQSHRTASVKIATTMSVHPLANHGFGGTGLSAYEAARPSYPDAALLRAMLQAAYLDARCGDGVTVAPLGALRDSSPP